MAASSIRKIVVVTSSRADYGLLFWLMKAVEQDAALKLQLVVTGMHLLHEFGSTFKIIENDGFRIDRKVEMLLSSDSPAAITKSIGVGCIAFADALQELQPHLMVLPGDRFELLAAAIAGSMARTPIAHLHGGETSQGAVDEAIRHSLTKMAAIHFPATEKSRQRIIQMGEHPETVFNHGAPGLDHLYRTELLSKEQLEKHLEFSLDSGTALITYHPVTLENDTSERQIENLLSAVKAAKLKAIFSGANADAHGRIINSKISSFCKQNPARYKFADNLGQRIYLSCLKHVDVLIGNSSSGLTEAPSFRLPVVNIGDRQKGREKAANVIDVGYSAEEILSVIHEALSDRFKQRLSGLKNPYDKHADGRAGERIKDTLKSISLSEVLLKKAFHDLPLLALT